MRFVLISIDPYQHPLYFSHRRKTYVLRHIFQKETAVMTAEEPATTGADLLVKALIDEEVEVVF
ncbi:MAG: hypothetical protein JO339_23885, partial [Alphaproteobacteria bacterium]|nr:hypothetical protein [Alphaproteobacteria bacterium]